MSSLQKSRFRVCMVVVISMVSFTGYALGVEIGTKTLTGKVLAIDTEAGTIAIDWYAGAASGVRVFELNDTVVVTRDGERVPVSDIAEDDPVTVTFHQDSSGLDVLDRITISHEAREEQARLTA